MRAVQSLDVLNIPTDYQAYIMEYIQNISAVTFISRVILFGSCAKSKVTKHSDIDIFIITSREITESEETYITFHCLPDYSINTIPIDIIVQPESDFKNYVNSRGMVQQQVNRDGVDLSGLLHQRARN